MENSLKKFESFSAEERVIGLLVEIGDRVDAVALCIHEARMTLLENHPDADLTIESDPLINRIRELVGTAMSILGPRENSEGGAAAHAALGAWLSRLDWARKIDAMRLRSLISEEIKIPF